MSHVNLPVDVEMAGRENPLVAAERSIARWNKMEGTRQLRGGGRFMPGKAIDRDARRDTVKPPAIEPIHPPKT